MVERLKEALQGKGIQAKVIYSGGSDVDILAAGASKGDGLKFLLKQVQNLSKYDDAAPGSAPHLAKHLYVLSSRARCKLMTCAGAALSAPGLSAVSVAALVQPSH